MIAKFNRIQTILAFVNLVAGLLALAIATAFFYFVSQFVLSSFGVDNSKPISLAITAGGLLVVFLSGIRLHQKGGGTYGYQDSDLMPNWEAVSGGSSSILIHMDKIQFSPKTGKIRSKISPMSVTITPIRVAILVACLGVFWFLGGFTPLESRLEIEVVHVKSAKAWIYAIIAFVAGAISVSVIDHTVGHMDPTNLRFAYILFGIALMVLGIVWNHAIVSGLEERIGIE